MADLSQFSIYQHRAPSEKRSKEATDLMPFLMKLQHFMALDDVAFAEDPPDFIFRIQDHVIGVELTDLVPKNFGRGGYRKRAEFKSWKDALKVVQTGSHQFTWGEFSLGGSLDALENQLDDKSEKAAKWNGTFAEKWLLLHMTSGSTLSGLVPYERDDTPGQEDKATDFISKCVWSVSEICRRPHPFSYIVFFSGASIRAFPANGLNRWHLPVPNADLLARGAQVNDDVLQWRTTSKSMIERSAAQRDDYEKQQS